MATDLERLVVSLEANVRKFETEMSRARKTTDTELDGIEKKFTQTSKGIGAATSNIAAQFQDIAVQLQGGQNPFTIALQQGTQISQVLGQRGAGGAVGLLSGAFQSLLSPVSLATVGIIALGGAAINYFAKAGADVKTLDDLLEEHEKTIKALVESYGTLGKGIDVSPVKESTAVAETLVRENVRALQKEYKGLSDSIVASLTVYTQLGDAAGVFTEETAPKFKAFAGAIDTFRESARNGTPDVRALRASIAEIERTTLDVKVKEQAAALLGLTSRLGEVDTALTSTQRTVGALGQALSGETDKIKTFTTALGELSKIALPKLDDRQKAAKEYTTAIESAISADERRAAGAARDAAIQRINDAERKKAAEDAARTAEREADRVARRAEADQKAFDGRLENARKSTAMLQLEFDMLGKTEQQRDKARMQLDLESEAKKRNIELTAQQRASIDEVATAYAAAGEKFRQANGPLASFARQAGDTDKVMQDFALSGVRTLEDGLADVVTGASSASDAFKRMANAIIADLARIAIRRAVTGPIAGALGGIFGGGGGELPGFGTSSFVGPLPGRASGGPVSAGQPYIVGEKRPEVFVPDRSGVILPKVPGAGGGGITAPVTVSIDARGADAEGLAKLQRQVAIMEATLPSRIVSTVKSAQRGRQL